MALTNTQRATIRHYCGWSARFHQIDPALEQAMDAMASAPDDSLIVTAAINATPPGILALLADIDTRITGAYARIKASAAGSITLNPAELYTLRSEGRRLVNQLCAIMGVERRADVYGSGSGGRNWVGK